MKSTKSLPRTEADLSLEGHIRYLLALSLCVDSVADSDPLAMHASLDVVEAIIICERDLEIPEISDDKLLKCETIGALVGVIRGCQAA
jgi:hypothetical protein